VVCVRAVVVCVRAHVRVCVRVFGGVCGGVCGIPEIDDGRSANVVVAQERHPPVNLALQATDGRMRVDRHRQRR
jgi:hypothetical protein